jgi:hypothetical protein
VYGQFDLVDALHPSEIEALLTCKVEIAKKTTRFLSEWHMNWGMLSEENAPGGGSRHENGAIGLHGAVCDGATPRQRRLNRRDTQRAYPLD